MSYNKYLKYKLKYLKLKELLAGSGKIQQQTIVNEENNEDQVKNGVWNKLPSELYIIGDIHGDFFALKQSLELTGCINFDPYNEELKYDNKNELYYLNDGCDYYNINENVKWNPEKKDCFIVLAGDMIDRCRQNETTNHNCINTVNDENCDYKILKLLFDLDKEARKYNSRVIMVLGNHELFNIKNDLRYVSVKGKNDSNRLNNIKELLINNLDNIYGLVRINRYVVVHGGINDEYFKSFNSNNLLKNHETIEVYNDYIRKIIKSSIEIDSNNINKELFDDTPFMDRTLGMSQFNTEQCKEIFINNLLNINSSVKDYIKIIVAHCPQFLNLKNINLNDCEIYKDKIYKIDVGQSRAFDFYKSKDHIRNLLYNFDINMNPILFYNINNMHNSFRAVNILKLKQFAEIPISGKLSIEYFFETSFKNNKEKLLYLLSDIKKIFKSNLEKLSIELDNISKQLDNIVIKLSNSQNENENILQSYRTEFKKIFIKKGCKEVIIEELLKLLNEKLIFLSK